MPGMNAVRILLLEDAFVTSLAMGRALEAELPDCIVMRAQSLYEARILLRTYDFQFFVVDIQLPDGCGVDFLPEISERAPGAGVVIATATPLPKYRQRASEFGVLYFMEKPVEVRQLASRIARRLRSNAATAATTAGASSKPDTSFTASLRHLTALDVIQLKCLARASVRLDFTRSDGSVGRIYLSDGEIVHAEVTSPSGAGSKQGAEAFSEALGWRGGSVVEEPDAQVPQITIQQPWQSLILDACQKFDETSHSNSTQLDRSDPLW
jgi:DNA-binding response OmpR family regulator